MQSAASRSRLINRRQQGDLGEVSALEWFTRIGGTVFVPFGHSPDVDLLVELNDQLLRVQVKASTQTSTTPSGHARSMVSVATCGGNQSWNRITKRLDTNRFDFLFALTGDGRRWCIPAAALDAGNSITLGGEKYSEFEIEPASPISSLVYEEDAPLDSGAALGEYPSGQRTAAVNRQATPSQVRILPPPLTKEQRPHFAPSRYERKLGRSGEANINPKRRVTIPQGAVLEAGLRVGDRLCVSAAGPGKVLLERIELPAPTPPSTTAPVAGA